MFGIILSVLNSAQYLGAEDKYVTFTLLSSPEEYCVCECVCSRACAVYQSVLSFPLKLFHFLCSAKQIWHEGRGLTDNEIPTSFIKFVCSCVENENEKLLPERLQAEGSIAA